MARCLDERPVPKYKSSHETALFDANYLGVLRSVDENAAIVADRTCGQRAQTAADCTTIAYYYWGCIVRLYEDSSAKVGRFWFESQEGVANGTWMRHRLYTEARLPVAGPP